MTEKERKQRILQSLEETYPEAGPELHFTNPYETLVATILSAQCTDRQVNRVTPAVFARYPDVAAMAEATVEELQPMVQS
ncbi:MAG: endonuclease III, partial [Clostridia bacterium]|nr:endonuclease III [Clostridia bacterium]